MTIQESRKTIMDTIPPLLEEGFLKEDGCLSSRVGDCLIMNAKGVNLSGISENDLLEIGLNERDSRVDSDELLRHQALYSAREDIQSIIHSTSDSVLCCSKGGETIKPLLDDMAQIVGITLKTTSASTDSRSLARLVKAFRKRNSVLLTKEGALCGCSSMDDAHAICQVSEKACQAWIESSILGGGHVINVFESWLMRTVYLMKYSKQASKNK